MVNMNRRQFFKVTGATLAGSSLALLGLPRHGHGGSPSVQACAHDRNAQYLSLLFGRLWPADVRPGRRRQNARASIVHIEGDPDHPVNRGTLCPKGAALIDFIHSPNRLKYPEYRAPGTDKWVRMSWDDALTRITKLMKADRDANFVEKTEDGKTVNRWLTTGMLAASASSNEVGYITHKTVRSMGMLAFDNQARV